MATRPGYCPTCNGVHAGCRFGIGSACILGNACENPHHNRAPIAGVCRSCGGYVHAGELAIGDCHKRCHDKDKAA